MFAVSLNLVQLLQWAAGSFVRWMHDVPSIPFPMPDLASAGVVWNGAVAGLVKGDGTMPPVIPVTKAAPAGIVTVWSGVVADTYHNGFCPMSSAVLLTNPVLDSTLR
jgi:hypothetical protein